MNHVIVRMRDVQLNKKQATQNKQQERAKITAHRYRLYHCLSPFELRADSHNVGDYMLSRESM